MKNSNISSVTIGLPVFNGEKFLHQVLDSLLAQTFANFELIISDNASTDDTAKICQEYAVRDSRIRYLRQASNIGGLENFNFVLSEAHSQYFMWAAVDDQWEPEFIQTLLSSLENDHTAVGAFCPYQLVDEATGNIIEGISECDYASPNALIRLLKFTWHYRDTCIYGLMRRTALDNLRFKTWVWINSKTPYNIVYPMLYNLLSKGNFLSVGEKPLWFKSVTTQPGHSAPFKGSAFLGYLALIVRKINLFFRSIRYIYRGSKSIFLVLSMVPFLLLRLVRDCIAPIFAAVRIWLSGRKISELSPHEIWRLGVR